MAHNINNGQTTKLPQSRTPRTACKSRRPPNSEGSQGHRRQTLVSMRTWATRGPTAWTPCVSPQPPLRRPYPKYEIRPRRCINYKMHLLAYPCLVHNNSFYRPTFLEHKHEALACVVGVVTPPVSQRLCRFACTLRGVTWSHLTWSSQV